jgi:hypothetical protein
MLDFKIGLGSADNGACCSFFLGLIRFTRGLGPLGHVKGVGGVGLPPAQSPSRRFLLNTGSGSVNASMNALANVFQVQLGKPPGARRPLACAVTAQALGPSHHGPGDWAGRGASESDLRLGSLSFMSPQLMVFVWRP